MSTAPTPSLLPPWLDVLEIQAHESPPRDGFDRIYAHELGGMLFRETVPRAVLEASAERVLSEKPPANLCVTPVVSRNETPILEVFGLSLRLSKWELYREGLEQVRRIHADLFCHPDGLESHIGSRIAQACGQQGILPLTGPAGPFARCLLSTLRKGGMIPTHFDNYCFYEPTEFPRVLELVQTTTLVNALTLLKTPEEGGVLDLWAFDWAEYQARTGKRDSSAWSDEWLQGRASRRVDLRAGDTLIFDAGRIAHSVSPVLGTTPRISYVWHMGRLHDSSDVCYFV